MIASFFADHFTISENEQVVVNEGRLALAEENLNDWLSEEEAGVLILKTHGGSVVWIKNLYVKTEMRNRGRGDEGPGHMHGCNSAKRGGLEAVLFIRIRYNF